MSVLSDLLKSTDDSRREPVATPEWPELDGKLFAPKLNGPDRAALTMLLAEKSTDKEPLSGPPFAAAVVANATVDADGNRIFVDADAAWLVTKDRDALGRLFAAIDAFNFLSAGAQEGLRKNCEGTDNSASG
jgi:hypothetical protein